VVRRFLDPTASFRFTTRPDAPLGADEIGFDMPDAEISHEAGSCSMETLVRRAGIEDPAVFRIAQIVHDIDLKDTRHQHAETAGFEQMLLGMLASTPDDMDRVEAGLNLFDTLYAALRTAPAGAGRLARLTEIGFESERGSFHAKAARYGRNRECFVAKLNANFPDSPGRRGLPTIQGVLVLADADDGRLLAVMGSAEITAIRTAAASAVAACHLMATTASVAAIIGCGRQGAAHADALLALGSFDDWVWVTFLPIFLWIFLGAPYVERLRENRTLAASLSAITAAVVGVILNLATWFGLHVLFGRVTELRWGPMRVAVPDFSTLDAFSPLVAVGAFLAIRRFHSGLIPTLLVAAALGVAQHWLDS
jgi:hypothetical protein